MLFSNYKQKLRGRRLQLALAFASVIGWILQGYAQALMNGLLTLPVFQKQFPAIDTSTPELRSKHSTLQGTVVGLYEVGAAFGALSCYFIGDRFGRKKTTMIGAIVVLVGVVLETTSFSLSQLIVSRIVAGLGVGSFTATLPSWVAECSEADERGFMVMMAGAGAVFGVASVGWIELGFLFVPNENQVAFRFPIAFQAVFPLLVLCAAPFLTESPRWLISKDRHAEGYAALALLEDEPEDSEAVKYRVEVILNSLRLERQGNISNARSGNTAGYLNRGFLAVGVNILAQLSGLNVITFYSNSVLENTLGYSPLLARVITGCLQTWQFLAATSAVFLIDRFGRRRLLIIASSVMAVANAGLLGLQSNLENHTAASCSLIFYFVALAAFPIGLLMVPFMYSSEIAPLAIRSQVTALSGGANWLFSFLIAEITPIGFANISWRYYFVYVGTNSLAAVCFFLFAPETKGRMLEDIDAFFLGSRNPLQPVINAKRIQPSVGAEMAMTEEKERGDERIEALPAVEHS